LPETSPTTATSGKKCPWHHVEFSADGSCPVCQEKFAAEDIKAAAAKAADLDRRLGSIRLGRRYVGVGFDEYLPVCDEAVRVKTICSRYAETFADRLAGGDNLLLLGNPGTGKNMLAAAICNRLAVDGFLPLHTTAMRLVRRITETWGAGNTEKEQAVIDSFTIPDLLVVDEVGVQFGSRKEEILLFEALNGRYEEKKPTVIISNLTLQNVEVYLGASILDRFYEGKSSVLEFTWGSYRRGRKG